MCPLAANTHGVEFLDFSIGDYESKNVIFNVTRDNATHIDMNVDFENLNDEAYRCIRYQFSEDVLRLPGIQVPLMIFFNAFQNQTVIQCVA